jgi:hypothetical protein
MPNQSGKVVLVLVLVLLILAAAVYFFSPVIKPGIPEASLMLYPESSQEPQSKNKTYQSEDLEISFEYPKDWFVSEKNLDIMVTSYLTVIGDNNQPTEDQLKFFINNFYGCHETIDENLKDPACGEGGSKVKPNEILSKEVEDLNEAKFYKYLVKYPSGKQVKFYFLEKGDRRLQIDKNPDPSKFEAEFENLINSIKFLD